MVKLDSGIEMVSGNSLAQGDRIFVDDGSEAEVTYTTNHGGSKSHLVIHLRERPPIRVYGYWRQIFRRTHKASRDRERDPDRGCYHCLVFDRGVSMCRPLVRQLYAREPAPPDCPIRTEGQVRGPGGVVIKLRKKDDP